MLSLSLLGTAGLPGAGQASAASRGVVLIANKGDQNLGIIDPEAGRQVATIPEDGITGHEVIASPDGKTAYVPIFGNSGVGKPGTDGQLIRIMDIASRKVTGTFDFGKGVRPHCPMIGPKDGLLYVTTELESAISVVDPRQLKLVGTVPTGQIESHMLAISRDGRRGYTANVAPGTVSVLDLEARKTLTIIPVSGSVQRIALSPDDKLVFTSDQTKPRLAVIDTGVDAVKTWVPLPGLGYGTAATPDGRWLLVAVPGKHQLAVVDLLTFKVAHTLDLPPAPQEVLMRPDGLAAYVSCDASAQVAAIDTTTWKVDKLIKAGRGADGLAWAPAP